MGSYFFEYLIGGSTSFVEQDLGSEEFCFLVSGLFLFLIFFLFLVSVIKKIVFLA